jgi:signal peptidase I
MKKSAQRESFESLISAVALALFARTFVFQAFKIPCGSMEKRFLDGDHQNINKMGFAPAVTGLERALLPGRPIKRGDVIVFKYPVDPTRDFIKRVIGLPGDRLELKRKKVYINGQPLEEPYVQYLTPIPGEGEQTDDRRVAYGPVTVPAGQYFMMGDNRDNSEDSRWWGFAPATYVKGQALFIYFSTGASFGDVQWGRLFSKVR